MPRSHREHESWSPGTDHSSKQFSENAARIGVGPRGCSSCTAILSVEEQVCEVLPTTLEAEGYESTYCPDSVIETEIVVHSGNISIKLACIH